MYVGTEGKLKILECLRRLLFMNSYEAEILIREIVRPVRI